MKHLTIKDINPVNYRYYVDKPKSNFSPERNYAIINQVLAENDKMQTEVKDEVKKNAGNVADILASFAKYKLDIGGGKQMEEWLGKKALHAIYGDKLVEKMRMIEIIRLKNRQNGNDKFEDYYLT